MVEWLLRPTGAGEAELVPYQHPAGARAATQPIDLGHLDPRLLVCVHTEQADYPPVPKQVEVYNPTAGAATFRFAIMEMTILVSRNSVTP